MSDAGAASRPEWWEIDDWFRYKDYDGFSSVDATGWAEVLGMMRHTLALRKSFGVEDWWEVRAEGWRELRESKEHTCGEHSNSRPLVDLSDLAEDGFIRRTGFGILAPGACPVLQVDLRTPDTVLVEAFTTWLADQRQARPLPIVRRGRPSALGAAIGEQFDRWARYSIAAVFDLDFWAFLRNSDPDPANHVDVDRSQGNLPTEVVAARVFPDLPSSYLGPEKARHVSEARLALREALGMYPIVALQAKSEIR